MNANDPLRDSQFNHPGWNTMLVALGRETVDYPPEEDFLTRNSRVILAAVLVVLLADLAWSIARLRRRPRDRPRPHWVLLALVVEIALARCLFFGTSKDWTT